MSQTLSAQRGAECADSNPTLELHDRVLADLDRRDAVIAEQEAEARSVLGQALTRCAAERASIQQERVVLLQAGKLYRRFIETSGGAILEANAALAASMPVEQLVDQAVDAAPPGPVPVERLADREVDAAPVSDGDMSVLRELRRQLWMERESQSDVVKQSEKWTALEPVDGASTPL